MRGHQGIKCDPRSRVTADSADVLCPMARSNGTRISRREITGLGFARVVASEKAGEYFQRLGVIGVVPKRNPMAVLDQLTKLLAPVSKAIPASARAAEVRTLRASS